MVKLAGCSKSTLRVDATFRRVPILYFTNYLHLLNLSFICETVVCRTMSSPTARRSQRSSKSATPVRPARNTTQPRSSPAPNQEQQTADASQHLAQEQRSTPVPRTNIASSSPLFFRSSPANGRAPVNSNGAMDISSPLRQVSIADSDTTPRGRVGPTGRFY